MSFADIGGVDPDWGVRVNPDGVSELTLMEVSALTLWGVRVNPDGVSELILYVPCSRSMPKPSKVQCFYLW